MAESFADLGLRPELVEAAIAAGYEQTTELQRAAIPVLRRGSNAVLAASAGGGVVAAYGLALLDRLSGEEVDEGTPRPRAAVLVPTVEAASRTAESLARFARSVGLRVGALGPGWARPERNADVLVGTPAAVLEGVQAAVVKLDGLRALVVDGASTILSLGGGEALETLMVSVPREAQRVVTSADLSDAVEEYVERHVRRAFQIPPRPVEEPEAPEPEPKGSVGYVVATEGEKLSRVAELLAGPAGSQRVVLYCRTAARAAAVADGLAIRGFAVGAAEEAEGVVTVVGGPGGAPESPDAFAISYDVPFDAGTLATRHATGGVVVVEPRELPHLHRIVAEAGFRLQAEPVGAEARPLRDEIAAYRDQLRRAVQEEDLGAQLAVLEPLLEEFSATELAAAASALARRRVPLPPAAPAPAAAPAGAAPRAWVRLFISVGQRDGIRPADLVGAITGEADVTGAQVGRIEIRDTFSIVEVASEVAERVIQALNGTTLKGRSLRVDYDRRGITPPRRGTGR